MKKMQPEAIQVNSIERNKVSSLFRIVQNSIQDANKTMRKSRKVLPKELDHRPRWSGSVPTHLYAKLRDVTDNSGEAALEHYNTLLKYYFNRYMSSHI